MFRSIFLTGIRARLVLVLLLGAIAFTPFLTPATVVAQEEIPGVCDLYDGNHPTIERGSTGGDVLHAQCLLNEVFAFQLAEDGIFGRRTEAAVADLQITLGLEVDGIIGDCTWAALHTESLPIELPPDCFP